MGCKLPLPRRQEQFDSATSSSTVWATARMRITGKGIWGAAGGPRRGIRDAAARRSSLGSTSLTRLIPTGPNVSEELIAEALWPYPQGLVIATKGGWERVGPGQWTHNAFTRSLFTGSGGRKPATVTARTGSMCISLHVPDPAVSFDASMETAGAVARAGQNPACRPIQRHVGACGARPQDCADCLGAEPVRKASPTASGISYWTTARRRE